MTQPLRYLHIEDRQDDVELIHRVLCAGGYDPYVRRVETAAGLAEALREPGWDLILTDWTLPDFNALAALAHIVSLDVDVPVIIVSDMVSEDTAVEALKAGVHNYVMKDRLVRLVPAIRQALREADERKAHLRRSGRAREAIGIRYAGTGTAKFNRGHHVYAGLARGGPMATHRLQARQFRATPRHRPTRHR